jgi:hypothetical protein
MNIYTLTKFKKIIFPVVFMGSMLMTFASPFAINTSALSGSSFNSSRIIDDSVFFDSNSMGAQDVQAFLSSKVPNCDTNHEAGGGYTPPFTCLKDYRQNIQGKSADAYCTGAVSGGMKSAAQIIKDVSVACSISPKVLIVLLQKEQSLITDTWPWPNQYEKATGYACPDTAPCDPEFAGFFNQIWYAARQFQRYVKQPQSFNFASGKTSFVSYQANNPGCGGTNITIQNSATAALYNYTPYQPNAAALNNLYGTGDTCSAYGNRNFWRLFSDWFGSPVTGACYNGYTGPVNTNVLFRKERKVDYADLTIYSGASTGCVESHVWQSGYGLWLRHTASVQPSIDYPNTQLLYGDLDGSGNDYPVLFGLTGTTTGMIESHVLNQDMQRFLAHSASNRAIVDPGDMNIRLADLNGDGKDEPILVAYRNTGSGRIELHAWAPGMQSWMYHIATNRAALDPSDSVIEFGDIDGDGRDEAILISFRNTGSGRIEFHVWNNGQWSWRSNIASNMSAIDPNTAKVMMADIDGDGRDEAILIGTKNTGSGRIEFHVWNNGMQTWKSHIISNQITIQ